MSACIDLHCHTTLSDGQCSPDLVCDLAQRNGIKYLALTDHNFDNPDLDALRARHPDLHILRGCEFSCMYQTADDHRVEIHVVGLNYDPACEPLRKILAQNQPDRRGYVTAHLEKLRALGIDIGTYEDLQADNPDTHHLGRMQIARRMVAKGFVPTVDDAFDKYIGSFGQKLAYVTPMLPYAGLAETVSAIREAKGVPILAHLYHYQLSPQAELCLLNDFKKAAGPCAGIEVFYGRYTAEQRARLAGLAQQFDLLPSAGSDFHGSDDNNNTHGCLNDHVPAELYDAIAARQLQCFGAIHS